MKTVLAFGTFDSIHDGHRFFLKHAKALGDRLVVGVARDAHVRALKDKDPSHGEDARLQAVRALATVEEARLSDEELGTYRIVTHVKPNVIAIGHDQDGLFADLNRWMNETGHEVPTERISKREAS